MLLHASLYEPRVEPAVARLERLARGRSLDEADLTCTIPTWQQRLPGTKRVLQSVREAISADTKTRAAIDLPTLANTIAQWLTTLDPQAIVRNLRQGGHSQEALTMVQELILNDPKPEHLVIAADLYAEDLGRPIEAIALYEAAIAARPGYGAAFSQQLRVLLDAFSMGVMPGLLRRDGKSDDDLDALIRRDFGELPADEHDRFVEPMAHYLLAQQRFVEVLKLVWAELHDRDKQFLWFKFGLRLVYLEAMLGLGKLAGVAEQLADIAAGLERVERNRSVDAEELRAHRAAHRALSDELERRRQ
jgi:tetratricopeptide (TPR) repeat protein